MCSSIRAELQCEAILDGEIICLDVEGRSQFYELIRHRGRQSPAVFYVFDLLALDGEDLRTRPLVERSGYYAALFPSSLRRCFTRTISKEKTLQPLNNPFEPKVLPMS